MSMYSFQTFKRAADVPLSSLGEATCAAWHGNRYSYQRDKLPKPATRVFVSLRIGRHNGPPTAEGMVFVCNQHAGTIKSQMTKGSWGWRQDSDIVALDVTPDVALASFESILAFQTARLAADRVARERSIAEGNLAYAREGWDSKRVEYARRGLPDTAVQISNLGDDHFGRVFIQVSVKDMTPGQARELSARLLAAADTAETITFVQVKP